MSPLPTSVETPPSERERLEKALEDATQAYEVALAEWTAEGCPEDVGYDPFSDEPQPQEVVPHPAYGRMVGAANRMAEADRALAAFEGREWSEAEFEGEDEGAEGRPQTWEVAL